MLAQAPMAWVGKQSHMKFPVTEWRGSISSALQPSEKPKLSQSDRVCILPGRTDTCFSYCH